MVRSQRCQPDHNQHKYHLTISDRKRLVLQQRFQSEIDPVIQSRPPRVGIIHTLVRIAIDWLRGDIVPLIKINQGTCTESNKQGSEHIFHKPTSQG